VPEDLRKFKANLFQALAHPTRIAIVEALRDGEQSAGTLQSHLELTQSNISQHLAILRARQVVSTRKSANVVYYSLRHPVLIDVLDILKHFFHAQLSETARMLKEPEFRRVGKG